MELPSPAGDPERYDPDAVNRELYRLLVDTVEALHQRQVPLTARDCRQIPQLVCERERPERRPHPPFMPGETPPRVTDQCGTCFTFTEVICGGVSL